MKRSLSVPQNSSHSLLESGCLARSWAKREKRVLDMSAHKHTVGDVRLPLPIFSGADSKPALLRDRDCKLAAADDDQKGSQKQQGKPQPRLPAKREINVCNRGDKPGRRPCADPEQDRQARDRTDKSDEPTHRRRPWGRSLQDSCHQEGNERRDHDAQADRQPYEGPQLQTGPPQYIGLMFGI